MIAGGGIITFSFVSCLVSFVSGDGVYGFGVLLNETVSEIDLYLETGGDLSGEIVIIDGSDSELVEISFCCCYYFNIIWYLYCCCWFVNLKIFSLIFHSSFIFISEYYFSILLYYHYYFMISFFVSFSIFTLNEIIYTNK
jgi:hypothetical protein